MKFADRGAAGRRLATELTHLRDNQPVVLALPLGGVAGGFEIAQALGDIVLVRKIGVPWRPELALGAVTDGLTPARVLDTPESYLQKEMARQLAEIGGRWKPYRTDRPPAKI